ncbi:MAG: FHA domain-containing protein [Planctomycetaceae bacterium]|nr:FHA domain-containing protein [Planctomycetaceae bacterium]
MFGELNPTGGGDPIPLLGRKLLIGRRSSCDIVLAFPNVSSHHCELELKDGYWHVRDLGSSNGVLVNGEKCIMKPLYPGDELGVGKYHRFKVEYVVGADAKAPAEEEETSMSLLEKAGLQAQQSEDARSPEAREELKRRKQSRRLSAEDAFIIEWYPEI